MLYLSVFLGGGLGSALRFMMSQWSLTSLDHYKLPTMFVNILGSAILGCLMALMANQKLPQSQFALLAVGFCGGLTTFSTFIFDIYSIAKQYGLQFAVIYTASSFILALLAFIVLYFITVKWVAS